MEVTSDIKIQSQVLFKPSFTNVELKTTSNGKRPQISKLKYISNHWLDLSRIQDISLSDQTKLRWKMTSNIKSDISQQPLVRSTPNLKRKQTKL